MTVRPRAFLDQAVGLQSATDEIASRAAISRAYYAALHRVIEAIPEEFFREDDTGNTHQRVIAAAERMSMAATQGRTAAREIARALRQLRRERTDADYELDLDIDRSQADIAIARTERVFGLCDELERKRSSR